MYLIEFGKDKEKGGKEGEESWNHVCGDTFIVGLLSMIVYFCSGEIFYIFRDKIFLLLFWWKTFSILTVQIVWKFIEF